MIQYAYCSLIFSLIAATITSMNLDTLSPRQIWHSIVVSYFFVFVDISCRKKGNIGCLSNVDNFKFHVPFLRCTIIDISAALCRKGCINAIRKNEKST